MKVPYGIWMLASRIWRPWPSGTEVLWINFWIMFTTFAEHLAWTMTSPSSRLGSIKGFKARAAEISVSDFQRDGPCLRFGQEIQILPRESRPVMNGVRKRWIRQIRRWTDTG